MKILLIVIGVVGITVLALGYLRSLRVPGRASGPPPPDADLAAQVAAVVDPLRKPTVLLRKSDEPSASYLGGAPPAYPGFSWPVKEDRPLGFLACIDLSQVTTIDWLPKAGLLLFFYDLDKQPWGFDPKDRGGWAVLHVPDASVVTGPASFPDELDSEWRLPRRGVSFKAASIPPPWDLAPLARAELSDD